MICWLKFHQPINLGYFQIVQKYVIFPGFVQIYSPLNISRAVISEPDLLYATREEILENIANGNFIDIRGLAIRRNEQMLSMKHLILTFKSTWKNYCLKELRERILAVLSGHIFSMLYDAFSVSIMVMEKRPPWTCYLNSSTTIKPVKN